MKLKNCILSKRILAALFALVFSLSMLSACAGNADTGEEVTEEPAEEISDETDEAAEEAVEEEPEEVLNTIGDNTPGSVEIRLTNGTGQNIKSFVFAADGQEAQNMLAAGDLFAPDETRLVYLSADSAEAEPSEETADDEKVLNPEYTLTVVLEDDSTMILHNFPLEDIAEGTIMLEKREANTAEEAAEDEEAPEEEDSAEEGYLIGYLNYKSIMSDSIISSLEAERAILDQMIAEEEARKAEEEAAAQAEAEAAAAAAAQQQAAPSYSNSSSGGGCIDDGLFN